MEGGRQRKAVPKATAARDTHTEGLKVSSSSVEQTGAPPRAKTGRQSPQKASKAERHAMRLRSADPQAPPTQWIPPLPKRKTKEARRGPHPERPPHGEETGRTATDQDKQAKPGRWDEETPPRQVSESPPLSSPEVSPQQALYPPGVGWFPTTPGGPEKEEEEGPKNETEEKTQATNEGEEEGEEEEEEEEERQHTLEQQMIKLSLVTQTHPTSRSTTTPKDMQDNSPPEPAAFGPPYFHMPVVESCHMPLTAEKKDKLLLMEMALTRALGYDLLEYKPWERGHGEAVRRQWPLFWQEFPTQIDPETKRETRKERRMVEFEIQRDLQHKGRYTGPTRPTYPKILGEYHMYQMGIDGLFRNWWNDRAAIGFWAGRESDLSWDFPILRCFCGRQIYANGDFIRHMRRVMRKYGGSDMELEEEDKIYGICDSRCDPWEGNAVVVAIGDDFCGYGTGKLESLPPANKWAHGPMKAQQRQDFPPRHYMTKDRLERAEQMGITGGGRDHRAMLEKERQELKEQLKQRPSQVSLMDDEAEDGQDEQDSTWTGSEADSDEDTPFTHFLTTTSSGRERRATGLSIRSALGAPP